MYTGRQKTEVRKERMDYQGPRENMEERGQEELGFVVRKKNQIREVKVG